MPVALRREPPEQAQAHHTELRRLVLIEHRLKNRRRLNVFVECMALPHFRRQKTPQRVDTGTKIAHGLARERPQALIEQLALMHRIPCRKLRVVPSLREMERRAPGARGADAALGKIEQLGLLFNRNARGADKHRRLFEQLRAVAQKRRLLACELEHLLRPKTRVHRLPQTDRIPSFQEHAEELQVGFRCPDRRVARIDERALIHHRHTREQAPSRYDHAQAVEHGRKPSSTQHRLKLGKHPIALVNALKAPIEHLCEQTVHLQKHVRDLDLVSARKACGQRVERLRQPGCAHKVAFGPGMRLKRADSKGRVFPFLPIGNIREFDSAAT